jgi:putative phosphoesterase
MQIVIISDTHGNVTKAGEILATVSPFDLLIHLGDHYRDLKELAQTIRCPAVGVLGNEDTDADGHYEVVLPVGDALLYLTHGHQFGMNPYLAKDQWEERLSALTRRAREEGARAALFGHTHKPFLAEVDDILLMNPGDLYFGQEWSHVGTITVEGKNLSAQILRFGPDLEINQYLQLP